MTPAASASASAAAAALLPPSLLRIPLPPTTTKLPSPTFPPPRRPRVARLHASYRGGSAPESIECPVPLEQQPVNEYQSLSTSLPFSWASGDLRVYCSRLAFTGASFALFVGLPVATFGRGHLPSATGAEVEAARCAIGAASTGLLAVTLAVLRMYLGWAYVGNRLLSATVEYEETGWYDGQIWIKTPEVLARDRLLGSFQVKPVLNRVKVTLVGLAISLVACAILFISLDSPKEGSSIDSNDKVIQGVYSESSAELFEPDVFHSYPNPIMKVVD